MSKGIFFSVYLTGYSVLYSAEEKSVKFIEKYMPIEQTFAWLASVLTTLIFIPQLYKAFKTHQTRDISMLMLVLAVMGNVAWLVHASLTGNTPLVVCATLIIIMSFILIGFKYKNEKE